MRRIGLILLIVGVIGFLVATSQRDSYKSVEGVLKTTFSKEEKGKSDLADTGRWVFLAVGIVGLLLVFVPDRKG